jgi:hypothetical protein
MAINFFSKKKKEEAQNQENTLTPTEGVDKKEKKTIKEEPKLTGEDIQEINRVLDINTSFIKSEGQVEIPTIIDLEVKKKDIRKKKIRFKILLYTFIISSLILILTPIGIRFYKEHFIPPKPVVIDNDDEVIESDTSPKIDPEQIVEYKNDDLRISLEHLYKAPLFENIEQAEKTKKIDIIYDKYKPNQNINVEDLSEGYIFRVSTFFTNVRTLNEIAQVKKESFSSKCPSTTTITPTQDTFVDGIDGRSFEVLNCGADYKVTYVLKNGQNYEFSQIFKGDLGYRQAYKAETEDILNSVEFYPDDITQSPEILYDSKEHKLSFLYPRDLSTTCCFIEGPIASKPTILLTVGDEETYVDKNNMDAVGIYIDKTPADTNFDMYVERQKKLLTDDYIVTMGEEPKSQTIVHTKVGDRNAIMLKGYSWKGNDLIYVDGSPNMDSSRIVVLSVKNISGERFNNVVNRIMESFKFNVIPARQ